MHCTCCIEISRFVNVAKHACDQCNNFDQTLDFY